MMNIFKMDKFSLNPMARDNYFQKTLFPSLKRNRLIEILFIFVE